MISKEEIEDKSKQLAINISDIQRDYLFGWILKYIFGESSLKQEIFLKGGNALRKAYFIDTRFSSDLDFGTPNDIDHNLLTEEIQKACKYISDKAGIEFVTDRNSVQEKFGKWKEDRWKVFEVKIYFKDFYGNSDHITIKITLDVTRFDKTYLPIQSRELLHPYSDSDSVACEIQCMQLEEILATKLKCLLQREHPADIFDFIYSIYLNSDFEIDKKEIRKVFLKRTIFEKNPSIVKNILLKLPMEYLKASWSKTIVCAQDALLDLEDSIEKYKNEITLMFEDVPDSSFNDQYYFNPEYRNMILKAGRETTLLKIIYSGVERLVEPYSLKFQERRDGISQEYLYVYDRVGGSSGPGWKRFVFDNTQNIEITEEKFEPRFDIELRKAGEYPEEKLLYDPYKTKESVFNRNTILKSKRVRRVINSGPRYRFKCSVCGKNFYRKTYDNSLSPHKNKNGFLCYGFGIYKGMKY